MIQLVLLYFVYVACYSKESYTTNATNLAIRLQEMLDLEALYFNASFQLAFILNTGETVTVASGPNDYSDTSSELDPNTLIPVGSVTKGFTAVGTMRLVEQGKLSLDSKTSDILDPWLKEHYGITFTDHFAKFEQKQIREITLRDLLAMTSGLGDYDDGKLQQWTWDHPNDDWTPINLLQNVSRYLVQKTGAYNGTYSSTGYNMAGLMWAAALGLSSWEEVDVKSVMVPNPKDFPGWNIAGKGPCSKEDPPVSHQYAIQGERVASTTLALWWRDIIDFSCLNAWTAGGLQTTAAGLADFWFRVFGTKEIISQESILSLFDWHYVSIGTYITKYGLGVFPLNYIDGNPSLQDDYTLVAHAGEDWGSAGSGGYNFARNYSFGKTTNVAMGGMNCSFSDLVENFHSDARISCKALEIFTQESWNPTANLYCDLRYRQQKFAPRNSREFRQLEGLRYICRDS